MNGQSKADVNDRTMNGQTRSNIHIGAKVRIVLKADQPTGKLTEGVVMRILKNSPHHPHGIKVCWRMGRSAEYKRSLRANGLGCLAYVA